MSQQGPLPFLHFCDVEVANGARTIEYLRGGLADTNQGHWELGAGEMCGVLYRLDSTGCNPTAFVSPAADPAPWYDSSEPGSETFLGIILTKLDGYGSTIVRGATSKISGLGGATLSAQYRTRRTWEFEAVMVSSDAAGAEYGLRWLTHILQQTACDTCGACGMTVRLVCPDDDCSDDTLGEWISYDVALTDGPKEIEQYAPGGPPDVLAGCRDYVKVAWTMVAANPFLYKAPETCYTGTLTNCFADHCCAVEAPAMGVLGSIFTLESTLGYTKPINLRAYSTGSAACGTGTPDLEIQVAYLPPESILTVDSSQHKVTIEYLGTIDAPYAITNSTGGSVSCHGGKLGFDNFASQKDATIVTADCLGSDGNSWPISEAATLGQFTVHKAGDPTKFIVFQVTGISVLSSPHLGCENSCAYTLSVVAISWSAASPFTDGMAVVFSIPTGDGTSISDGTYLLNIPEGENLEWLEVRDCDTTTCFCIEDDSTCTGTPGTFTATIETQRREG